VKTQPSENQAESEEATKATQTTSLSVKSEENARKPVR